MPRGVGTASVLGHVGDRRRRLRAGAAGGIIGGRGWAMTAVDEEVAAVLGAIARAFPVEPVPAADALTPPPHDLEDADIRAAFGGRRWTEVPDYHVARSDTALSWFAPAAFCYYLPAYLSWRLADAARARSGNAADALVAALLPTAPGGLPEHLARDIRERWRERRALLSREQAAAVARWLRLVFWHLEPHRKRDRDAMRRYQRHWKPLLPPP